MVDISEQLAVIKANPYGEDVKQAIRDALALIAPTRGGEEIERMAMGLAAAYFLGGTLGNPLGEGTAIYDTWAWGKTNPLYISPVSDFPATGESGTYYISVPDSTIYVWNGSEYEELQSTVIVNMLDLDMVNGSSRDGEYPSDPNGGQYAPNSAGKVVNYTPFDVPTGMTKMLVHGRSSYSQTDLLSYFFHCYDSSGNYMYTASGTAISTSSGSYKPWSWKPGSIITSIPSGISKIRIGLCRNPNQSPPPSLTVSDLTEAIVIFSLD